MTYKDLIAGLVGACLGVVTAFCFAVVIEWIEGWVK